MTLSVDDSPGDCAGRVRDDLRAAPERIARSRTLGGYFCKDATAPEKTAAREQAKLALKDIDAQKAALKRNSPARAKRSRR